MLIEFIQENKNWKYLLKEKPYGLRYDEDDLKYD